MDRFVAGPNEVSGAPGRSAHPLRLCVSIREVLFTKNRAEEGQVAIFTLTQSGRFMLFVAVV